METTEKIVESYCRYIRNWFTISNIKIKNNEIDLLAIDIAKDIIKKYHIEVSVSISSSFKKLNDNEFSEELYKQSGKKAAQRRTLGYFIEKKFENKEVLERLSQMGFKKGNYSRIIVSWDFSEDVHKKAKEIGIELWDFKLLLVELGNVLAKENSYYIDDTLRTIQLYQKALVETKK